MSLQSSAPLPRLMLVFFGPPGSGKGTYAKLLARQWNLKHVSTGDLIRNVSTDSVLGQLLQRYTKSGQLVPEDLVQKVCWERLISCSNSTGWILDGYPRTLHQAKFLNQHVRPDICVNFVLPDDVLVGKLLGRRFCNDCGATYNLASIRNGPYCMPPLLPKEEDCYKCHGKPPLRTRPDDNIESIKVRLQVYNDQSAPILDFFRQGGSLLNFDVQQGVKDMPRLETKILSFLHENSLD